MAQAVDASDNAASADFASSENRGALDDEPVPVDLPAPSYAGLVGIDPVSTGAFVGKALASKAFTTALSKAASRLKQPEAERLLALVADDLNAAIGPAGLEPLLEDEHAADLIVDLLVDPANADEHALATAIEPHVGRHDEQTDAADYAIRVAASLRRNVWRVQESDRAAIVGQLQTEVSALRQEKALWASPRFLSDEWVPRAALDRVKDLAQTQPDEAASLERALSDESTRRAALRGLINDPPGWVSEGSAALWTTLGQLGASYGFAEEAAAAFIEAAERPDADRASLYARASQFAVDRQADEEATELLRRASAIEACHPDVVAAAARQETDPNRGLELLAGAQARSPTEVAAIEIARMLAYVELEDIASALEACERALEAAPNAFFPRQMKAALTLAQNRERADEGDVDRGALYEAARQFLDLAAELDALGRHDESARVRSQASASYALAGDRVRAARVLEEIPSELAATDELLVGLVARAALQTRRPDIALAFLGPSPQSEEFRLFRARARFESEGDETRTDIVEEAEALLEAHGEGVREDAALLRLEAALRYEDTDWPDEAEAIVRDADPALAAMIVAERLARDGDVEAAHDTLAPHQDDPRVLEILVRIAAQQEDWTTAIQRQRALLDRAPTPSRRLDLAGLLEASGDVPAALGSLAALRVDGTAPIDVRASAFGHSADILWRRGQVAEFSEVAAGWLELVPDAPAAAWARVYALVRLARYRDATELIDERSLEPRHVQDGRVAAQAFYRALPAAEAVERIAGISDHFERRDPGLELMVIVAGLGGREAELPEELHERRARAIAEFDDRFPDSGMMTKFDAPDTPEELHELLRQQFDTEASKAFAELNELVMEGKAGVAHVAAFVGKEVAEVWTRLGVLPLGFGNPVDADLEYQDAVAALDKPAVWESGSLYVVGGLGGGVEETVRKALLGSVVPLAVLDDAARAADGPIPDEQGEVLEIGWDPLADEPRKTVYSADEVDRQRRSLQGVLKIAQELIVEDNVDPDAASRFDELFPEEEDARHQAVATVAATLIVADRLQLPVYSDDRFVRALARGAGLPTFGTFALLDALVDRGRLDEGEKDLARRRLRLSGAHGLPAKTEELIAEAREQDWQVAPGLIAMLADRGLWFDTAEAAHASLAFLRAVHNEAPSEFDVWVARLVDAARAARPKYGFLPPVALLLALAWLNEEPAFIAALTGAIETLPLRYAFNIAGYRRLTVSLLAQGTAHLPSPIRTMLLRSVLSKLDFATRNEFFERMSVTDASSLGG
jgi:hypothetical protein